jgi:hypothetical protein
MPGSTPWELATTTPTRADDFLRPGFAARGLLKCMLQVSCNNACNQSGGALTRSRALNELAASTTKTSGSALSVAGACVAVAGDCVGPGRGAARLACGVACPGRGRGTRASWTFPPQHRQRAWLCHRTVCLGFGGDRYRRCGRGTTRQRSLAHAFFAPRIFIDQFRGP